MIKINLSMQLAKSALPKCHFDGNPCSGQNFVNVNFLWSARGPLRCHDSSAASKQTCIKRGFLE